MQARIYQNIKPPTQSGIGTREWVLDFYNNQKPIDKIMGWSSSNDTTSQIKLHFSKLSDAEKFAKEKGWNYEIIKNIDNKNYIKKSYSENFL